MDSQENASTQEPKSEETKSSASSDDSQMVLPYQTLRKHAKTYTGLRITEEAILLLGQLSTKYINDMLLEASILCKRAGRHTIDGKDIAIASHAIKSGGVIIHEPDNGDGI